MKCPKICLFFVREKPMHIREASVLQNKHSSKLLKIPRKTSVPEPHI